MIIGYGMIDLFLEGVHSLKGKRRIVLKILDRSRNKFPISMAEVDMQDLWQRARLGYCVVGSDRRVVERILQQVADFVESLHVAQITWLETGIVIEKGQKV